MTETTLQVRLPEGPTVTAVRAAPPRAAWTFVYAPGAGSNIRDPFGAYAARELAARGVATLRFQFPYMEAGRRSPDRTPVLEAAWRAVIDAARDIAPRLVAGGRSMGGRIASQVVAQGARVDALALFAYPLHPPGKPERMRDEHLPAIGVPVLFCSGTNDAFASPDELRALVRRMPRATLHLIEHADHGFAVPKASGRTKEQVWAEAVAAMSGWLSGLE